MLLAIQILFCILLFFDTALAKKHVMPPPEPVDSVFVLDNDSNSALYENNSHKIIAPASMAKLMTAAIVFDALANKKISPEQELTVTHEAWINGGAPSGASTMFAKLNSQISVSNLLHGLIIDNANDAALMLSQLIAGDQEQFAKLMNIKAKQIGLRFTSFTNATGLPQPGSQQTTNVKDLVLLLQYVIKHYPSYVAIAQQPSFSWNNITQHNKNPLLNKAGTDIKILGGATGYTKNEGYAMVACIQKGQRIVYIALANAPSGAARLHRAIELINMAFNDYQEKLLYTPSQTIIELPIYGGVIDKIEATPNENLVALIDKENKHPTAIKLIYKIPVLAPIQAGEQLGTINILRDGQLVQTKALLAKSTVNSAKFTRRASAAAYELFFGWIQRKAIVFFK